MKEESVTKTIISPLESSQRKNERLRLCIEEYQQILDHCSNVMISFPEYKWGGQSTQLYRVAKEALDEQNIHSQAVLQASNAVGDTYSSWLSNGKRGRKPAGEFGDGNYIGFTNQGYELANENGSYGIKVKLEPYDSEWFGISDNPYNREYLDAIMEGEQKGGSIQIRLDGEQPQLYLTTTKTVNVPSLEAVETYVGVDLGETTLYAIGTVGATETAAMESGRQYRHHREEMKAKKQKLQAQDKLRELKALRNERERYTDHILHTASREIVDTAREFDCPALILEDLTGYREGAGDRIHDWPFAELQENICYKAREEGIPVMFVDPAYTSQMCRKCGSTHERYRTGTDFECGECGYEVHADINGAFNIAARGKENV